MATARIKIEAESIGDVHYYRAHGLMLDGTLDKSFWATQPDSVIGKTAKIFHYETSFELELGRHTIEYGVSEFVGQWSAKIYINDRLMAQGVTDVDSHLIGTFVIGPMGKAFPLKIPILNISVLRFPPILSIMKGRMGFG